MKKTLSGDRQPSFVCLLNGDEAFGVGGPALTLARGLQDRGWRCRVVALAPGELTARCEELGLSITILGESRLRMAFSGVAGMYRSLVTHWRYDLETAEKIVDALADWEVDQICFRWPSHILTAGLAANRLGARSFWIMPNLVSRRWWGMNRWFYNYVCSKYDITALPNSQYTAKSLSADIVDNVLYLGIDTTRFDPLTVCDMQRESLGIPPSATVFGIFARIDSSKGQLPFCEAIFHPRFYERNLHLLLVGAGEEDKKKQLEQSAVMQDAADRIHFTGWTSQPERYYPIIDVAVNARVEAEPFGLSVVEAMAMQKPVLVHALGGPTETVIDGVTGWHLAEPTVESFIRGIDRSLADRSQWLEMGVAARQRVIEHFSREVFVENYLKLVGP